MLRPGQTLGRYRVVRPLGEGGQGQVYAAMLEGPGGFRKPVALKVLRDGGEGLIHEARLGGLLRHPNLVEVYALEEVDGTWVCAMELVEGGPLAARIPMSPGAAVDAVLQACAGLEHAWSEVGLIHLDLKPENLLLAGRTVKVADLGIARARGFARQNGLGTPAYMAPEQLAGGAVDGRADVFALGLTLIALVTGFPRRDPTAVPELSSVLARAIASEPNDRYPSVHGLAAALGELDLEGAVPSEGPGALGFTTPSRGELSFHTFAFDDLPRTNLEADLDSFVGRGSELAELEGRVAGPGAVLLRGLGGVGKTRLARRVGLRWHRATGNEVWFCDLTASRDPHQVAVAVADALDLPLGPGPVADQVSAALEGRGDVLLILDNCEQVVGLGPLVDAWLDDRSRLRILLTSRSELALSDPGRLARVELEPLPTDDARSLLVARAPGVDPDDPALADLAERLDGLPLALELCASRFALLTPGQVLARLDQRLKLLARRGSDRHATLRATLDASVDPLDPALKGALVQLSVFEGGFDLEAADAVLASDGTWALDRVGGLLQHSLLSTRVHGEDPRFAMLESVRDYARDLDPDQARAARDRHARAFAALGTPEALERLDHHGGAALLHRLVRERANLAAAARHALSMGDGTTALHAAVALFQVLELRGPAGDFDPLIEAVLALELDEDARAQALEAEGRALRLAGRVHESLDRIDAALALARERGDAVRVGILLSARGVARRRIGQVDEAHRDHREALELVRRAGHRRAEGDVLSNLGAACIYRGDLVEGEHYLREALVIHREVGNQRSEALALGNLAIVDTRAARPDAAERAYRKALELHRLLGDKHFEGLVLGNLTVLYSDQGQLERAIATSELALALHRQVGARHQEAISWANHASLLASVGDFDAAEQAFDHALAMHREASNPQGIGVALAYRAEMERSRGDLERARAMLVEAVDALERAGDTTFSAVARCRLAVVLGELGDPERAIAGIEPELARLERGLAQAAEQFRVELALALAATGQVERARSEVAVSLAAFRERRYPRDIVFALCAQARIQASAGAWADAAASVAEAEGLASGLVPPGPFLGRWIERARSALGESP